MRDAFRGIDVLREIDLGYRAIGQAEQLCLEPIEDVAGDREQLAGRAGVTHVVRAFAHKPQPPPAVMKARTHPVAFYWRRSDGDGVRVRQAADSTEGVGYDEGFDLELAPVGDVRVEAAAAQGISRGHMAIG